MFTHFFSNKKYILILVLILLIITGIFIYLQNKSSLPIDNVTLKGEVRHIDLPHGAFVVLDESSQLHYNPSEKSQIELKLSGKANIELRKKEGREFRIFYNDFVVRTTNANFLIRPIATGVELIVSQGQIEVERSNERGDLLSLNLSQGETGRLVEGQNGLLKMNNRDKNYLAWIDKKFFFEGTSIQAVCELLTNVYKVEVLPANSNIGRCRFVGNFENQTLDEILEEIAKRYDLSVVKSASVIILEGKGC